MMLRFGVGPRRPDRPRPPGRERGVGGVEAAGLIQDRRQHPETLAGPSGRRPAGSRRPSSAADTCPRGRRCGAAVGHAALPREAVDDHGDGEHGASDHVARDDNKRFSSVRPFEIDWITMIPDAEPGVAAAAEQAGAADHRRGDGVQVDVHRRPAGSTRRAEPRRACRRAPRTSSRRRTRSCKFGARLCSGVAPPPRCRRPPSASGPLGAAEGVLHHHDEEDEQAEHPPARRGRRRGRRRRTAVRRSARPLTMSPASEPGERRRGAAPWCEADDEHDDAGISASPCDSREGITQSWPKLTMAES